MLRLNRSFRLFFLGQSLSLIGSRLSTFALPTIAVTQLGARPSQVGLLVALDTLGAPLVSSPLGALADVSQKRHLMILSDMGRLLTVGAVAAGLVTDSLSIWQLYFAALAMGLLTTLFDVSAQAYIPHIVASKALSEANSRLAFSRSVADIGGPPLAGVIIRTAGAAFVFVLDALSYLASVVLLWRLPQEERSSGGSGLADRLRGEAVGAFTAVFREPTLRELVRALFLMNLGGSMILGMFYPYVYQRLELPVGIVGLVLGFGSLSALLAAFSGPRIIARVGLARASLLSASVAVGSLWLIPMASVGAPVVVLTGYELLFGFAAVILGVTVATARQQTSPPERQGGVYGVVRTFQLGAVPLGAAAGGFLGSALGLVPGIALGAGIAGLSLVHFSHVSIAVTSPGVGR